MSRLKQLLSSPYPYIYILAYVGVWLAWDGLKLPFSDPRGIISYLPTVSYNPSDNILRFVAALLLPPVACWIYWWLQRNTGNRRVRGLRHYLAGLIVIGSLLLALLMGIFQNSTNPANNQPEEYGGPYSHALLDTFHEGETLGPAISYEQPDLKPYRDFVIVHGVFQDPLRSVIAFKLFGKSIGAERAFTTLLVMAALVCYYLLLLLLFRGNIYKSAAGLSILAILMLPAGTVPVLSRLLIGVQFPFRDIATIAFLAAAVTGLRATVKARWRSLAIMSALMGLVVFAGFANSIDRALYIATLSVVWLVMVVIMLPLRQLLKTVLPAFVLGSGVGLFILGLALKWDFVDFLSYLKLMTHYKEFLDGIVFSQPGLAVSLLLIFVGSVITWGGVILFGASGTVVSNKGWTSKLKSARKMLTASLTQHHTAILLFITGIFFLRSAVGRSDFPHFAYSVQWLYLFVTFVVLEYAYPLIRRHRLAFNYCILLALLAIFGQYTLAVKKINIRADAFPIHVSDRDLTRPDYQQTAAFLKSHLSNQDSFVTLTSEGSWYYLVDKPSPIRYYVIWYAFTAAQRHEIADGLATNTHIRYIVTNNNWTSDFDYVPNPQRFPEVYTELNAHYHPLKGIGQQTIWQRNN